MDSGKQHLRGKDYMPISLRVLDLIEANRVELCSITPSGILMWWSMGMILRSALLKKICSGSEI